MGVNLVLETVDVGTNEMYWHVDYLETRQKERSVNLSLTVKERKRNDDFPAKPISITKSDDLVTHSSDRRTTLNVL